MYRCRFCGACSKPGQRLLKFTKYQTTVPVQKVTAVQTTDLHGKPRTVRLIGQGRSGRQIKSETPVCASCHLALSSGLSEKQLRRSLRLQGKGYVNKRIVAYDGLQMSFGGTAINVPLEAKPVTRIRFGSSS